MEFMHKGYNLWHMWISKATNNEPSDGQEDLTFHKPIQTPSANCKIVTLTNYEI